MSEEDRVQEAAASSAAETSPEPEPQAVPMSGMGSLDLLIDVPLRLTVHVGSCRMALGEVLQLGNGSIVELDRGVSEPADILVNGTLVARGDLTTVDDRVAVRVVEVVKRGTPKASG